MCTIPNRGVTDVQQLCDGQTAPEPQCSTHLCPLYTTAAAAASAAARKTQLGCNYIMLEHVQILR